MTLVSLNEILIPARKGGYAVGAFEFWSLDSAQAVVEAAQEQEVPVILQAGWIECVFAGGIKYLYKIAKMVADDASIPVALHLDHAEDFTFICQAIEVGFTSVMIDGSSLPFAENVAITRRVVEVAHPVGVSVEAELGKLAGVEGYRDLSEEEAAQTDPAEARLFIEETGIDALAVAIGTAHGFYKFPPKINLPRLQQIATQVNIPLVLHGGSATPDELVRQAIGLGIAKVNICTEFVAAFGKTYIETQAQSGFRYNIPGLFGPSKAAGKALAAQKIRLFHM
jgi:fructose-bisphosphate aldolase class II